MNQCLEEHQPPAADLDIRPEAEAAATRPDTADGTGGADAKRVLVLEDDANLCRMITIFLESKGFEVVAVASGLEGLREIMAGEFAAVLCDIMMPGLPGDMFYRAVEKTRPDLCPAFLFMTGFLSDCRIADFIASIGGNVLQKPFPLSSLLEALTLAEQRRKAFIATALSAPAMEAEACVAPEPSPSAVMAGAYQGSPAPEFDLAALRAQLPQQAFVLASGSQELSGRNGALKRWRKAGWTSGLLLTAGLFSFSYYTQLETRVTAVTANRAALQEEWTRVSQELAQAQEDRIRIHYDQTVAAQLAAERERPRLSAMLRAAMPGAGKGVDLREISSRHDSDDRGAAEIRVRGIVAGAQPRAVLEQYRQDVENELRSLSYAPAPMAQVRAEQVESESEGVSRRISFEMTITHRPAKATIAAAQQKP